MEYGVTEYVVNASPLENPRVSITDPQVWEAYFGQSTSSAGIEVNLRSVMGYPPVYRAVSLIAAKCAGTPLQVIERETKEPLRDHFAFKLVGKNQQANVMMNSYQWARIMTVDAQIYGGGWSVIDRDNRGRPVGLMRLDPMSTCKAIVDGRLYWTTRVDNETVSYADEDVFHLSSISPDGLQGWSMLDLMRDALGLPLAAQQFSSKYFANGSNLSGVLMVPGHFSPEKIQNTMNAWNKMQTGLEKAHKIALLQDGVKWQPVSVDPAKSQLNETQDHELRATVSNITGVPPHLLGDSTRTSHNSLESENISLLQNCLRPWFDVWESELNQKLRTRKEKKENLLTIEFNTRDLLRMEFDKRVTGYAKLKEIGVLTTNEIRKAENMPAIGPEGDERYVPANWVPATEAEPMETNETPDPPAPEPMRNALRAMIASSVTKSLQIESEKVVRAANSASNMRDYVAKVDQFYTSWVGKTSTMSGLAVHAFHAHAEDSKRQLMDVINSTTETGFAGSVSDCVATWEGRAEALTDEILKELSDENG